MRGSVSIGHLTHNQWKWFMLLFIPLFLHARTLKFTEEDRLLYKGYEVERFQDSKSGIWVATLKKGGKVIATFDRDGHKEEWTQFGPFPCLGNKETHQLIVEQYSGGAHCCWSYWIVDLYPNFRVLYDSDKYSIGYPLDFIDLDGDGVFEFTQNVLTFDYFDVLCHAVSPLPTCVFKYDKDANEYLPASHMFPAYVLEGFDESIKEVKKLNEKVDFTDYDEETSEYLEYLASVLNIVITYIYAGKEEKAWTFYDKEYRLPNKEEMKFKIREKLKDCPVYKCIYKH